MVQPRKEAPLSMERMVEAVSYWGWVGQGRWEHYHLRTSLATPASLMLPAFCIGSIVVNSTDTGGGLGLESQLYHLLTVTLTGLLNFSVFPRSPTPVT